MSHSLLFFTRSDTRNALLYFSHCYTPSQCFIHYILVLLSLSKDFLYGNSALLMDLKSHGCSSPHDCFFSLYKALVFSSSNALFLLLASPDWLLYHTVLYCIRWAGRAPHLRSPMYSITLLAEIIQLPLTSQTQAHKLAPWWLLHIHFSS